MMTYVVFAGNFSGLVFREVIGYMHALADQGVIDDKNDIVRTADVMEPHDLELHFRDDPKIKDVLSELGFKRHYLAVRARVADRTKLEDEGAARKLCERYDVKYGIYNFTEEKSELRKVLDNLGSVVK